MNKVARLSTEDRKELFMNTAAKIGMHPAIVEKDFWVCFMLDYLFHRCKWKEAFAFKGGTSLSKAYKLIRRFSEDIDLILDWRLIGYDNEEPWLERSNTKQEKFNEEANERAAKFLKNKFVQELRKDVGLELKCEVDFHIDQEDDQTVDFVYPQIFSNPSILQQIRLEIGALAAWTPAKEVEILPFVAEQYPKLFEHPTTSICTVTAERTFWEKVTILHKEANRINGNFPKRYSRHYYDLYCIDKSEIKEKAFRDMELLSKVVTFKNKFYRCNWAKYDEARIGTMKLVPDSKYITDLEQDYLNMCNMLYGDIPDFDEIMRAIERLENEINILS